MPIGNVSSQIFANIYLNELDQFIKQGLRIKNYFRYADDFVIIDRSHDYLTSILPKIEDYLRNRLDLQLHPNKVCIRKLRQGIDFLGYIILPHHIVLRTKTKYRMMRKLFNKQEFLENGLIDALSFNQSLQSYLGMLKHCNGYKLENLVKNIFLYQ